MNAPTNIQPPSPSKRGTSSLLLVPVVRLTLLAVVAVIVLMLASRPAWAYVQFSGAQNSVVGDSPEAVVSADFNADNKADLAVANLYSDNVSVLLGNGDGTFAAAQNFGVGDGPNHLTSADFNADNKVDLAVANLYSDNVSVLLGNGNGTFAAAQNFTVGDYPFGVTSADFNADNKADLAVANVLSNNISILLGNGNGTFAAAVNYGGNSGPTSVTSADFNGDSKLDLAAVNGNRGNTDIHWGNGDGTFTYGLRTGPIGDWFITSADFNGDSKPDLVALFNGFLWDPYSYYGSGSVVLNNGGGTFGADKSFTAGHGPTYLATADFNADSKLDLAVTNAFDDNVSVLTGNGDGTFAAKKNFGAGDVPASVATADFNGDSKPDLAVANENSDNVSVLLNTTVPDTVKPNGTVVINNGAAYTTSTSVTLKLSATDPTPGSGVAQMRFSNNGSTWSAWGAYATTKSWTLGSANGTKTVYAQFRDGARNASAVAKDTIVLDTAKPAISSILPAAGSTTRDRTPNIAATVRDSQTNLAKSHIRLTLDGNQKTTFSYNGTTDRLTYTPGRNLAYGTHTVKIVATDLAGNVGSRQWSFKIVR